MHEHDSYDTRTRHNSQLNMQRACIIAYSIVCVLPLSRYANNDGNDAGSYDDK
jgi:hypothetical protein